MANKTNGSKSKRLTFQQESHWIMIKSERPYQLELKGLAVKELIKTQNQVNIQVQGDFQYCDRIHWISIHCLEERQLAWQLTMSEASSGMTQLNKGPRVFQIFVIVATENPHYASATEKIYEHGLFFLYGVCLGGSQII